MPVGALKLARWPPLIREPMEQHESVLPHVLVVSHEEWAGRSLESVLQARNYSVSRVSSGRAGINALRRTPADAVICEEQLHDSSATEFCRLLRREPAGLATPIIVIAARGVSPHQRVAVYAAGAWDYCSQPLDVAVLLLKLDTFVAAGRELRDTSEDQLVDRATNLYTLRGLRRWSREVSARAVRGHEPLACVALSPTQDLLSGGRAAPAAQNASIARAGEVVARQRRESDVAAYVGDSTFAILAPATGPGGAARFVDRLQRTAYDALEDSTTTAATPLHIGYSAVVDFASANVDAIELFRRASTALNHLRRSGQTSGVLLFDDIAS